jgi:hypothetical protein
MKPDSRPRGRDRHVRQSLKVKAQEKAMARLPIASRESVPEAQRALFDELVQRMGSVPHYGPGSVMIHVPEAHRRATGLNEYLRNWSSLSKKV